MTILDFATSNHKIHKFLSISSRVSPKINPTLRNENPFFLTKCNAKIDKYQDNSTKFREIQEKPGLIGDGETGIVEANFKEESGDGKGGESQRLR